MLHLTWGRIRPKLLVTTAEDGDYANTGRWKSVSLHNYILFDYGRRLLHVLWDCAGPGACAPTREATGHHHA